MKYLSNQVAVEDIVQEIFVKLWEKREQLSIDTSLKSYLFQSAHNSCLNFLKHLEVEKKYSIDINHFASTKIDHDTLVEEELNLRLYSSIESLPEKCRLVFKLSRFEGLKQQEIANKLGISVKTVKNHIGKALKIIRKDLGDLLLLIIISHNLF